MRYNNWKKDVEYYTNSIIFETNNILETVKKFPKDCTKIYSINITYLWNKGVNRITLTPSDCPTGWEQWAEFVANIENYETVYASEHAQYMLYDSEWDNYVVSHSVASGFSGRELTSEEIRNRLINVDCHEDLEIACSDASQTIGAAGVFLTGETLAVSNIDLWSQRDGNQRYWEYRDRCLYARTPDEYSLDEWDHVEHIKRGVKLQELWIKDWAIEEFPGLLDAFKLFAIERDLCIRIIEE